MFINLNKNISNLIQMELDNSNKVNIKKDLPLNNYLKLDKLSNEKFKLTILQDNKELGEYNIIDFPNFKKIFSYKNSFIAEYDEGKLNIVTFVDLHGHTGFSLLDGMNKIKDFAKKTVFSRAITDHGVMYGCIDFYKEMKKNHKKPIIGFEAYTETIDGEEMKRHLVLLATSEIGYNNVSMLSTLGASNYGGKFPQRPIVKYEWLRAYSEGVIALSACIGGEIQQEILNGNNVQAEIVAKELKNIFGENFYMEIQRHNIDGEAELNKKLIQLAKKLNIKVVATTDTHYLNKDDSIVHEIHLCNQVKKVLSDPTRYKFPGDSYHVHTIEEMEEKFSDIPEVLFNTLEVMDKCNFNFEFGHYKLPKFPVPEGLTESKYLRELALKGFKERFNGSDILNSKEYKERLEFELETINNMGYPAYFLIVWDFVKYAKDKNYPVGPGRGSACGSLVSYCLKITDVDPIPYGLLFERFLNPDRKSMPDIDMDFGNLIREDIINYCREKYGSECVSKIITFTTLSAKAVVRDVAKIMYDDESDKKLRTLIANAIPTKPKMTLKKAFEESPELNNLYNTNDKVKKVIDNCFVLEGLPKACSQHACGLIISDKNINNYCPQVFLKDVEGIPAPTTQYTMTSVEELGLLKMDFLGLKTMTVLDENVNDINNIYGKDMSIYNIPINDPLTYENIAKGNTSGVFQLESNGMTSFMNKLFQDVSKKINELKKQHASEEEYSKLGNILFERLIAGVSLYRPGPMDEIPRYIDGMMNPSHILYDTPELKNILDVTYGVIVYQEQVMTTVRELANFNRGQADTIRKSMGKKLVEILDEYKDYFIFGSGDKLDSKTGKLIGIKGCIDNGISEKKANIIWDKMYEFSKYAFNKSHAAGYAVIGVRTGWVNTHYPTIFMKANLNTYIDNNDKLKPYLAHCYKEGIAILPPSINESMENFTVKGKEEGIRYGLRGLSKLKTVSALIFEEREERGVFNSFQDFVERMITYQKLNKGQLESLIFSGAVDDFEGTRKGKILSINDFIIMAKVSKKATLSGQITLFDFAKENGLDELANMKNIKIPDIEEYNKDFLLEKEKEFAGAYITGHPLDAFQAVLKSKNIIEIAELSSYDSGFDYEESFDDTVELEDAPIIEDVVSYIGENVSIAGIITNIIPRYDKNDRMFMTFTVEDRTGELGAVCFNNALKKNQLKISEGQKVIINGTFDVNDFGPQINVDLITDLEQELDLNDTITLVSSKIRDNARNQWIQLQFLTKNKYIGTTKIVFIQNGKKFDFPQTIELNQKSLNELQNIFGGENCKINNKKL